MNELGIAVTLYSGTQVLLGFVKVPYGQRLSDLLNGATVRQPENKAMFIELGDVTALDENGTKEKLQTSYINKATIQLVITPDNGSGRGIGAKDNPKMYPFVEKSKVWAKMRVPGYEITGTLHCTHGQRVQQLLEERLMFLPLTEARIRMLDKDNSWTAPFAAVNREQIYMLQYDAVSIAS